MNLRFCLNIAKFNKTIYSLTFRLGDIQMIEVIIRWSTVIDLISLIDYRLWYWWKQLILLLCTTTSKNRNHPSRKIVEHFANTLFNQKATKWQKKHELRLHIGNANTPSIVFFCKKKLSRKFFNSKPVKIDEHETFKKLFHWKRNAGFGLGYLKNIFRNCC